VKRGFARSTPAEAPGFAPAPIELPTPLKVPPPEGKPLWSMGYVRWGEHPEYALVRGQSVTGFFYYKRLRPRKNGGGQ
jgi:hypothetical protein